MKKELIIYFFVVLFTYSCVPHKKGIYFQKQIENEIDSIPVKAHSYLLNAHDVINIKITSTNPQVSEFFNYKSDGNKEVMQGYVINDRGYIYMPVIDSVKVIGLTVSDCQSYIQNLIREHVTDATVSVKLVNFNVTILGEVGKPGLISFDGPSLTVIEAIGLAGDISDFGNKKNVILIRKVGESNKFISLDLTKRDLFASEYYYLQPNDVIYVEPVRAKNFKLNMSQISLVLGFTTLLFFIYNISRN